MGGKGCGGCGKRLDKNRTPMDEDSAWREVRAEGGLGNGWRGDMGEERGTIVII